MKQKASESFRDRALAKKIAAKIGKEAEALGRIRLMHVCGTHEDTITKYGLRSLLPENIEVYSGPGCPVCVTTTKEIDEAVAVAEKGAVVTSFGDMLKVPGSRKSLGDAKTEGCDIRVVYSITDALDIAKRNPSKEVVHVAVGFETTAPSTASAVKEAPKNLSILSCHRLIPPAMDYLLSSGDVEVDGFIDPGHVSAVIGLGPYKDISLRYGIPQVVAGFEPVDVLFAILLLTEMIKKKDSSVRNEYTRVVRDEGNQKAMKEVNDVFDVCGVEWRGFPVVPNSGLGLRKQHTEKDARKRFGLRIPASKEPSGCQCGRVLRGQIHPEQCPLFAKKCSPQNPVGACMVSSEGSCSIAYRHRKNA